MNLSQIVSNEDHYRLYAGATDDGLGGTCYLAGVCPQDFIKRSPSTPEEVQRRVALLRGDSDGVLRLAKETLDGSFWFGLLEEVEKSLAVLKFQMNLPKDTDVALPHSNINKAKPAHPTAEELAQIERRLPMDVALYEYATERFWKRWDKFQLLNWDIFPPNW